MAGPPVPGRRLSTIKDVEQIRPNIFRITWEELGQPVEKGPAPVEGLGTVYLDIADLRYAATSLEQGFEPTFFVSRSPAMGNDYVVVSRQRAA